MRRIAFIVLLGLLCLGRADAFWQSRDSNYNINIASGGACSGWTPATPSGLIGWYNADSANVSPNTNGSTVTVMTDLSSGAHNMAPNGYSGPVYNTTGLGGKPALVFAGGNATGMRTSSDVVTVGTGSSSSIFMLASFLVASTGGPYIAGNGQGGSQGAGNTVSWLFYTAGSVPDIEMNHAYGTYGSGAVSLGTEQRLGIVATSGVVTPYVNNVAGTPGSPPAFSFTSPGTLGAASGPFAGTIRELIFYNTALGSTDRGCMDAYLVSRE